MKALNKKMQQCLLLLLLFLCGVILGGCQSDDELKREIDKPLVLNGNYGTSADRNSRNIWEEDESIASGLRFSWENSVDGYENLILAATNGEKIYEWGKDGGKWITRGKVVTTGNPLISQISPIEELPIKSDNPLKSGDEIYSYVPLEYNEDVLATHTDVVATMLIPREITETELNSTRHLSPYIYMAGKGKINEKADFLTSNIYYRVLPAILRFKITNSNSATAFKPEVIRITGDINKQATVKLKVRQRQAQAEIPDDEYKATETLIYSLGDMVTTRLKGVEIAAGKTANAYNLAFPTTFTEGKKLLFEIEGTYDGKKVERMSYLPVSIIPNSKLEGNHCYTFTMKMDLNSFEIGSVDCGVWTGSDEDITSTPETEPVGK